MRAEVIETAWDPMIATGESKGFARAEIDEQLRLHRKAVQVSPADQGPDLRVLTWKTRMKELAQVSLVCLAVDLAVFPNRKRLAHDDHHHDQATQDEPGAHWSLRTTTKLSLARLRGRDMTHTGLFGREGCA